MSERPGLTGAAVFAAAILLLLPGLGWRPLESRAEARIPMVALDIVRTGRIFPPWLLGEPYLNKPPLHHLLCAAAIELTGRHDEFVVRLPSVACGAAAIWLTWLLGRRLAGPRAGLVAAAFLFLSYRFFSLARSTELEILLTAATTLAYLGLSKVLWPGPLGPSLGPWLLGGLGVAIACLAKGPVIALLFPVLLLVADAVVSRTWRRIFSRGALLLLAGAVVGTAVYYGPLVVQLGGVQELKRRLAFENVQHSHGFHYYLWQLPLGLLPAGFALPFMLIALRRSGPVAKTCALAVGLGVVVFSLSASKQSHYLLPIYPLVAIWAGICARAWNWRRTVWAGIVAIVLMLAGVLLTDYLAQRELGTERYEPIASKRLRRLSRLTAGGPLAIVERHPLVGYYLDRADLEIVEKSSAANERFIEDRGGFVLVDLEKGEHLHPDLDQYRRAEEKVDNHTYVLLGPPEKTATRR